MKVVGLMSGTSMDGIDAALLELDGEPPDDVRWSVLAFLGRPYGDERRERLRGVVDGGDPSAICRLHAELGAWLAEATLELLDGVGVAPEEVAVVGSHGHTVWHEPPREGRRGATLQIGDPATLAALTGIPVVSDFRAADVAAGGHGAPLVPWPDRLLFSLPGRARALQNIGGIGNVTWLAPAGSGRPPFAFDTGPGNVLLDLAAERATGGRLRRDEDGRRAAAGTPDEATVTRLMRIPFFRERPPRSTGRELFGPALVHRLAAERGLEPGADDDGWRDLLATLTRFTARSIGDAYRRWVAPRGLDDVVVTGGGASNPTLVRRIREELGDLRNASGDPVSVEIGADALGMDPDAKEAAAFAVLAWAHLRGVAGNVPGVTGAAGPRVLGSLTPAPGRGPERGPAADPTTPRGEAAGGSGPERSDP
ncbi:MAG: anhydro-N-acetylmuramic acid kinase [Gemmatimonadota bacterium]